MGIYSNLLRDHVDRGELKVLFNQEAQRPRRGRALGYAFSWGNSIQGHDYWLGVRHELMSGNPVNIRSRDLQWLRGLSNHLNNN